MSDFVPMNETSPDDSEPVTAEAVLPESIESPAVARARRPLSRGQRALGLLGGVALMGFTLMMIVIMLFDGAPSMPECPSDIAAAAYARGEYSEYWHDAWQSWRFWNSDASHTVRIEVSEPQQDADAEPTPRLSMGSIAMMICWLLVPTAIMLRECGFRVDVPMSPAKDGPSSRVA